MSTPRHPAPTPRGDDLVVGIECTTGPDQPRGPSHEIVVHADWTIEAPAHDVDADRVGHALGAWSGCLHVVDNVVPAFRHRLTVMHRPRSILRHSPVGGWHNTRQDACTHGSHAHRALVDAVSHEISIEHAGSPRRTATHEHAAAWGLSLLFDLYARDAWMASVDDELVVGGRDGYRQLWHRGVLPEQAMAVARRFPRRALPLPAGYLAELHFAELELRARWVR